MPGRVTTVKEPLAKALEPDSLRACQPIFHLHPVKLETAQSSVARLWPLDAIGAKMEGRKQRTGSHRQPLALPARPATHPHAHARAHTLAQKLCIQPTPGCPRLRKRLSTPTPHAGPPRAGLAPPLLVLLSLPHVLAF